MSAIPTPDFDALDGVDPPDREAAADGDAYVAKARAWMIAFPEAGAQIKAIGEAAEANASIAEEAAATNLNAAALTATSTTSLSIGANTSKGPIAFAEDDREFQKGQWVNIVYASDATQGMTGRITAVDNDAKTMTVFVPTGGADGAGTYASWIISVGGKMGPDGDQLPYLRPVTEISGAHTLEAADLGCLLVYTGTGGHTWSGDIGVVGEDFAGAVRNDGTGYFTLDFSQDIDGKGSIRVYPGESFSFTSAAAAWKTIGRQMTQVKVVTESCAGVPAVAFETAFSDPETKAMRFRCDEVLGPAAASNALNARLKFGGSYISASNTYKYQQAGSGTNATEMRMNVDQNPGQATGWIDFVNPLDNSVDGPWLDSRAGNSLTLSTTRATLNIAQSGACQGIQFFFSGSNMQSGAITNYIDRV